MTREDFIAEQERICTEFAFGHLTRDEAENQLSRLGFDQSEIVDLLLEAVA